MAEEVNPAPELSLNELNAKIKEQLAYLNRAVDVQVKISDTQDELQRLTAEKAILEEHLHAIEEVKARDAENYRKFLHDPEFARELIQQNFIELSEKWPDIHPSQWFIPPPFHTPLPTLPRSGFKESRFARSVACAWKHSYRSMVRRYRFVPEISRRSATLKLEELRHVVADMWPAMSDLSMEYSELVHELQKTSQQITSLRDELESQDKLYDFITQYRAYCELARAEFVHIHDASAKSDFEADLLGPSWTSTAAH